ncbi:MAG: hypothetical protein ABW352_00360 [Polyangiales bacterium]
MSDDATPKKTELEWGDALDDWELALDDSAEAHASPFPLGQEPPTPPTEQARSDRAQLPTPVVPALADNDQGSARPTPTRPAPTGAETVRAPADLSRLSQRSRTDLASIALSLPQPESSPPPENTRPTRELMAIAPVELDVTQEEEPESEIDIETEAEALIELDDDALEISEAVEQAQPLEEALGSHPPQGGDTLRPFVPAGLREIEVVAASPSASEPPDDEPEIESSEETPEQAYKRARIERLEALAKKQSGAQRAELLLSAAELAEEIGERRRAEQLYEAARDGATKPALKALARLAFRAKDSKRYLSLLEAIAAQPGTASERARALQQLALARWVVERDAPAALGAATEAHQLAPELVSPNFLLARIELATDPTRVDASLQPLIQRTPDRALAATWLVSAGRAIEARGDRIAARQLYARAASDDPFAFDAQLSLSRIDHALGAHGEAARALLRTLESFDIGPVAEAVRRRAAHMLSREGAHAEALALLEHASDDVSLRTAAQIAGASGDRTLELGVVESWANGSGGVERALAMLTHAELLAELGQLDEADKQLEAAALADPSFGLVSVTRESIARRAGDTARLAEIAAGEEAGRGALAAAAKLALASETSSEELTWLGEAAEEEAGTAAHLLAIDASAELARRDERRRLLRTESERGRNEARVLSLLALAALERQKHSEQGDGAHAIARNDALQQASELAPREPFVLRAMARANPQLEEAAYAYRLEADSTTGTRAAFTYLREGFSLAAGSAERLDAFVCAATASANYAPASWALHREARRQGDLPRLSDLHTIEAEHARNTRSRAAHLVRAALIRASEDTEAAAVQLTRALELTPEDPVLSELVVRLGDAAPAQARVTALLRSAQRVREPWRRLFTLAAASTFEDDGRGDEAAEQYRHVLENYPDDPIAEAGLERVQVELRRGAPLLEEKRRAVHEASTERARARALEELLLLEREPGLALEIAHELAVLSPSHPLALRALERDAMERDDRPALLSLEQRFLRSTRGARDKAARLRFVHALRALEPEDELTQSELDRTTIDCRNEAQFSLWMLRQLIGSSIALNQREPLLYALDLNAEQTHDPLERAALIIARGWLSLREPTPEFEARLRDALANHPEHPTGAELSAELRKALGDLEGAATQFEQAGERALSDERAAHLWARAAELWDRSLGNPTRAREAYAQAAQRDIDYPNVRERLAALLDEQGDLPGLIALTKARVARGGPPEQLVELLRKLAALEDQRGDHEAARASLREALAHAPDSLPVWRDLARLAEHAGQHGERVEALHAVTRVSRDPLELRDILLELGDVYDKELGDPTRAEAAYQRVLKLGPRNTTALERLASLYRRGGANDLATEALAQLARATQDPRQKREVTLQLASWKEEQGDARSAEEQLEALRRAQPTDPELLRALANLLQRQNAHVALAMHLNRAVNDLRHALATRFDEVELWRSIVSMLSDRGRTDVAAQCAATAQALGLDVAMAELRPQSGMQSGIKEAAISELLDDLVFPERAPAGLRIVFRHAAEALNKVAPLDLRVLGADKLDKRHPLRAIIAEQARWIAHRDIEVYVSAELPYAFVPVQESPVQLLVGRALIDTLTTDEQRFLVARALKIARAQMSICCRLAPPQMELMLHGLVRSQVASYAPSFMDMAMLDETARTIGKQLSRRAQSELVPHLLELNFSGPPRVDAANVYGVASVAGSRAGLLATGNVDAALSALVKLSGTTGEGVSRAGAVAQVEEARELVSFAISEAYFEGRARAGKEGP